MSASSSVETKLPEYKIIKSIHAMDIEKGVTEALRDGWKLHGHLTIGTSGGYIHLYQALVKNYDAGQTSGVV